MNPLLSRTSRLLALLLLAPVTLSWAAVTLTPGNGGVKIPGGFAIKYPQLLDSAQKPAGKLMEARPSGTKALLKYDNGAQAEVSVSGGTLNILFSELPANVKTMKLETHLDFNSMFGASFSKDGGGNTPFPEQKPPKPHLIQGPAKTVSLTLASGTAFSIHLPAGTYVQLTDTREWGWKNFILNCNVPVRMGQAAVLKISEEGAGNDGSPAAPKILTDRFGQYTLKDWPGKIKSDEELKQDVADEQAYYASFSPPAFDRFGGLPGSGEKLGLKKNGFYHVEQKNGRWYLVNPDGNWSFYLGVCSIAPYLSNVRYTENPKAYEWLPPYESEYQSAFGQNGGGTKDGKFNFFLANQIKKYGQPYDAKTFTARMIPRLRAFGFNAGGAFGAGEPTARDEANFPYTTELPLREFHGIKRLPGLRETWDPFDEKIREAVDKKLQGLARNADNPLLIGYYLANEPLYEDIPRVVPSYKEDRACKRRLVQMLEEKYKNIAAFNAAWGANLPSFEEAAKQGLPVKTKAAADDMQAYKDLFLDEYYKFTCETARKYDPNHMLIGSRLQSGTINSESLCRIGAKYVDVWSYNYYTYGLDEEFLKKIYQWTGGKPMILSEFHYNSSSDSGVLGGAKDVASQQERGLAYRHYVEHAASLGFIVGAEWYTLLDGAITGFNANCGLIGIGDRPWKAMIAEMVKTNFDIYKVASGERTRFIHDDPRFTGKGQVKGSIVAERTPKPLVIDGQGGDWPGVPAERIGPNRLVQGSAAAGLEAAVKVCWDNDYLYVIADISDAHPLKNDLQGKDAWNGDALELFIGSEDLDKGGALIFTDRHILISAGEKGAQTHVFNSPEQFEIQAAAVAKDGGYILEAAIPWKALATTAEANKQLLFDIGIDDSADGKRRSTQLMWSGTAKNSTDRSHWGRLRTVGQ